MTKCSHVNTIKGLLVGLLLGALGGYIVTTIYKNIIPVSRLGKEATEFTVILNKPLDTRHLAYFTSILNNNKVNIKGICAVDSPDKKSSTIKIIPDNAEKAEAIFKKANLPIRKATVEIKEFDDIADLTKSFAHSKIEIETIYSMDDNFMAVKKR
jgi:hypothetical protein